ncbi:hypothetical protein SH1V18_23350 [Vallitalea longa]|uniref:Uncharacterized protein n=1 Tax=Vallitalea longa TaxID=2936439 RepID=A0A9W5YC28_9FIRM|nr:DUF6179 domain-containing protein [Vallitalea longa]GKX29855.1 hypothetical protein SH1V18_23350 [Vallitalea longa]
MDNDLIIRYIQNNNMELLNILKRLIEKYTFGESSSIKVEVAESLLASINYSIDAYFDKFSEKEGVIVLQNHGLEQVYDIGLGEVKRCLEQCKTLYKETIDNKLDIEVQAYNDTLENAIPYFLKYYNCIFSAHETMCCIDYPLAIDDMNVQGAYYIKEYLEKIIVETEFCRYFYEELDDLLNNYGIINKMNYKEELFNVFELVINNYVFSIIANKGIITTRINEDDYEVIVEKLYNMNITELQEYVDNIFRTIIGTLKINNDDLINYIDMYKNIFKERLISNINHSSLKYMIVTNDVQSIEKINLLDVNNKMDDDVFRELVENIKHCPSVKDITSLIKANVSSLIDFVDILKSDCLFEKENYYTVFDILGNLELAILGKMVYKEQLMYKDDIDILSYQLSDDSEEWQIYYREYIYNLDKSRIIDVEWLIRNYNIII